MLKMDLHLYVIKYNLYSIWSLLGLIIYFQFIEDEFYRISVDFY